MFRRKQKQEPLTACDFFMANDPGYLKAFPERKQRLIVREKENKPDECLCCIFLGHESEKNGSLFFCSLGDITFEYGRRAKECILDKKEHKHEKDTNIV